MAETRHLAKLLSYGYFPALTLPRVLGILPVNLGFLHELLHYQNLDITCRFKQLSKRFMTGLIKRWELKTGTRLMHDRRFPAWTINHITVVFSQRLIAWSTVTLLTRVTYRSMNLNYILALNSDTRQSFHLFLVLCLSGHVGSPRPRSCPWRWALFCGESSSHVI